MSVVVPVFNEEGSVEKLSRRLPSHITGVQFITLGLLAELQTRVYHESQDKATYVVREEIGTGGS
jgi:hypothetical protein